MGLFQRKNRGANGLPRQSPGADRPAAWSAPDSPDDMPPPLADLAFLTLDHSLDSVEGGGPLIPLVLAETAGGRALQRFVAATLEEGLAAAQRFVHEDDAWQRACLAYDGYLTLADQRYDAIHVRGWDRESATSVHVAHCYVPGGAAAALQRISGPIYLGAGGPPTA